MWCLNSWCLNLDLNFTIGPYQCRAHMTFTQMYPFSVNMVYYLSLFIYKKYFNEMHMKIWNFFFKIMDKSTMGISYIYSGFYTWYPINKLKKTYVHIWGYIKNQHSHTTLVFTWDKAFNGTVTKVWSLTTTSSEHLILVISQ
jgi:hypothetical protein